MDTDNLVLAALAAGGKGAAYPPAQVQKLFFLIDSEVSDAIGGKRFNFVPYDYGPFDSDVYTRLENAKRAGTVEIIRGNRYKQYGLTGLGFARGQLILRALSPEVSKFIEDAAKWVLNTPFAELVSAIYKFYPEMKANSIFRE